MAGLWWLSFSYPMASFFCADNSSSGPSSSILGSSSSLFSGSLSCSRGGSSSSYLGGGFRGFRWPSAILANDSCSHLLLLPSSLALVAAKFMTTFAIWTYLSWQCWRLSMLIILELLVLWRDIKYVVLTTMEGSLFRHNIKFLPSKFITCHVHIG